MANEKKFLDSSGIGHLWDRIEERYPNMDELGLIIDTIDEAKADRTDLETYEFISIADIDEICSAVTEGSLESTDVDYLMAQLNFGVSTDELSPEEIEKLMNKLQ